MLSFRAYRRASLQEPPFFFIRSRPLFIRLPVLAPRGMQEFFYFAAPLYRMVCRRDCY